MYRIITLLDFIIVLVVLFFAFHFLSPNIFAEDYVDDIFNRSKIINFSVNNEQEKNIYTTLAFISSDSVRIISSEGN